MNIDIANRLFELRREKGLSQEELAAKLGISRQAVSKWERAEAAPDTDNLITLAKLYNISLDELLLHSVQEEPGEAESSAPGPDAADAAPSGGNADAESASVKFEKGGIHVTSSDGSDVHVGLDGIFVKDGAENENVHVGWDGIYVDEQAADRTGKKKTVDADGTVHINAPGKVVTIYPDGSQRIEKPGKTVVIDSDGTVHVSKAAGGHIGRTQYHFEAEEDKGFWHYLPWPLCTLIAFLLIGFLVPGGAALPGGGSVPPGWDWGWLCFLTIPVYYSLFSSIQRRDPLRFCWPILAALAFFVMGYFWGLWHPGWVVFLTIPVFYPIAHFARRARRRKTAASYVDDDGYDGYVDADDEPCAYENDDEDENGNS